jgi:segregation and condensation protein B
LAKVARLFPKAGADDADTAADAVAQMEALAEAEAEGALEGSFDAANDSGPDSPGGSMAEAAALAAAAVDVGSERLGDMSADSSAGSLDAGDEGGSLEDPQRLLQIEAMRIAEALLFAASEPLEESAIAKHIPEGAKLPAALEELRVQYAHRGVNLARVAKKWYFRTASDLGWLLSREQQEQKKLSRAALETLAIVAYHQPVTRAEIEDIRGVAISRGTMDVLLETGWVRLRGRRKAPGRPVTYGTTDDFLIHFGLEAIGDLPGLEELKGAGLFDGRLPAGFGVPSPSDNPELREDEDPLDGEPSDLFDDVSSVAAEEEGPSELSEAGAEAAAAAQSAARMLAEQDAQAQDARAEDANADAEAADMPEEAAAGVASLKADEIASERDGEAEAEAASKSAQV